MYLITNLVVEAGFKLTAVALQFVANYPGNYIFSKVISLCNLEWTRLVTMATYCSVISVVRHTLYIQSYHIIRCHVHKHTTHCNVYLTSVHSAVVVSELLRTIIIYYKNVRVNFMFWRIKPYKLFENYKWGGNTDLNTAGLLNCHLYWKIKSTCKGNLKKKQPSNGLVVKQ